jgi:2,4-dichlorophenol 6-monooxygenase
MRVPVLIVGGGAAGLTTSMELSRLGVESLLVERHRSTSLLPKAHIINARTMEIFDLCGVAGAVYRDGAPLEAICRVAWHTSLTGPTELHGREIGHVDSWGGASNEPAVRAASPHRYTNLPLIRLEPLLRARAEELAPERVRFNHELSAFQEADGCVFARVVDRESGEETRIVADYLVAADGGRTIGPALGIELEGEHAILDFVNTYFSADLSRWFPDDRTVINFYVNPDGAGSLGSGVLIKAGPSWGADSEEWVFSTAVLPDDPVQFDHESMLDRMRRSLGIPDFSPDIHVISPWRVEAVLADRYREGRIFLVGDAAHRHPPTGGLGLNTGVADAHNLAWKLREVLAGHADDGLLDTYEAERRPVAREVVDHSVANLMRHANIDRAIGLAPETTTEEGWARFAELFSDDPRFDERRAAVAEAIRAERDEFAALGIDLGYVYRSAAVIASDGDEPPERNPLVFTPGTWPGQRMPHAWLEVDGVRHSTYELAGRGRFVLFVGPAAGEWRDAATGLDIDVIAVGGPDGAIDLDGSWSRTRGVGQDGAILIRPDGHVAWRAYAIGTDPAATLGELMERILQAPSSTPRSGNARYEHAQPS